MEDDTYQDQLNENIFRTVKKTRKAFLVEYSCGLFLLLLLSLSALKGIHVTNSIKYFIIGISFVALASAEFSRTLTRYKIMSNKVVIIDGIIKQNKKNIYYHSLAFAPELNVKQSGIQRLLGYGTIYIKTGGNDFEIKDVDNPHKILENIEKLMMSELTQKDKKISM